MIRRWCCALALLPVLARAELVDRVAAIVNNDIITLSQVQDRARQELVALPPESDAEKANAARKAAMGKALDGLIGETLMAAQIKDQGVDVTESELEMSVESVKKAQNFTSEQFAQEIVRAGYTNESYRKFLRAHLARMKLLNLKVRSKVKISNEDLRAEYAKYARDESLDFEVHARHILVTVPPNATPEQVAALRAKAAALATEARKPGTDFADLARKSSDGPSAQSGGDLGFFRRGVMQAEFERAAFALAPGQVSDPLRTKFGWHVIKLVEKRSIGVPSFDEMKDQLREKMTNAQLDHYSEEYVKELRDAAAVDVKL